MSIPGQPQRAQRYTRPLPPTSLPRSLLPPLSTVLPTPNSPTPSLDLTAFLSLLLEPSHSLMNNLAPKLQYQLLHSPQPPPKTYQELLERAKKVVEGWGYLEKADFIGGHPRIGEKKGLSRLSAMEQGRSSTGDKADMGAPQKEDEGEKEVRSRLKFLNNLYEYRYPTLRYLTFVNGRPLPQLIPSLETLLNNPPASPLSPPSPLSTPEEELPEPLSDSPAEMALKAWSVENPPLSIGSPEWTRELERGNEEVWRIAIDRLGKLIGDGGGS